MFPFFPYSNFHRLNADWILKKVQELATAVEGIAANVETWAARIQQAETDATAAVATANKAVRWDVQSLTDAQKTQARANIGAASPEDIPDVSDVVRYSPQELTGPQQLRARWNIGATSQSDTEILLATRQYVSYTAQEPTPAQQVQARANIGAAYSGDVTDLADRVSDVEDVTAIAITSAAQSLTDAQKAQARTNIGAGSATDVQSNAAEIQTLYRELNSLYPFVVTFSGTTEGGDAACDKTWAEISAAITAGRSIVLRYYQNGYYTQLLNKIGPTLISGYYTFISTPSNPDDGEYESLLCFMNSNNAIAIEKIEL